MRHRTRERAGLDPRTLVGSSTGVFVGVTANDYALLGGEVATVDRYLASGTPFHTMAGRLAYVLGLQGPAMPVDTAGQRNRRLPSPIPMRRSDFN